MKARTFLFIGLLWAVLAIGLDCTARADSIAAFSGSINDTGDLFEGANISEISPLYGGFTGNEMFGATTPGAPEPTNTIFSDTYPADTNFNVVFENSPTAAAINSYTVILADDSQPAYDNDEIDDNRGIIDFQLWAVTSPTAGNNPDNGGGGVMLANVPVMPNYYTSYGSSVIQISGNIAPPAVAHTFEAFFFSAVANAGPRVEELQGFGNSESSAISPSAVPLPPAALGGTALLLGIGMMRMTRRRFTSPA